MSTPDFLPQNDGNYAPVRFYTALDPYFYTVDNRPLQDLETNIKAARTGGGDSARRAAALLGLNLSTLMDDIYSRPGVSTVVTGLEVFKPSANLVRIGPGALYDKRAINENNTTLVLKQALLTEASSFNVPSPVSPGTSIVYTIVGDFVELTDANLSSSQLPYMDSGNVYLPSTLIHAELRLRIVSGVAANTGSEVPPAVSTGFPIYNLTVAQGSTDFKVAMHNSAPKSKGLTEVIQTPRFLTGGAVGEVLSETMTYKMPPGVLSTVGMSYPIKVGSVSPYKPIKLKIEYVPEITGGTFPIITKYKALGSNEIMSALISTPVEPIPVTSSATSLGSYTTNAGIPPSEFAGFVDGKWVVNKELLSIALVRTTAAGNTGNMSILSITLVQ